MNPIDLVSFAEHSQKLPAVLLAPTPVSPQTWKILLGHFIDFTMAAALVSVMIAMFNVSVSTLMVTQQLQGLFTFSTLESFSGAVIPFAVFNYFFMSYFFNHGQSWGLFLMQKRLPMTAKSFRHGLRWATHSSLLCLSGGLTFLMFRNVWSEVQASDYLYQNLMSWDANQNVDLETLLATAPAPKTQDGEVARAA